MRRCERHEEKTMTVTPLHVEGFFDAATSTVSYLVLDPATRACALIDSVLDYDPKSGRTSTAAPTS
jgi:glyoxylase-like metal-dependent hydrolase (beta-lactamase superfamily II)